MIVSEVMSPWEDEKIHKTVRWVRDMEIEYRLHIASRTSYTKFWISRWMCSKSDDKICRFPLQFTLSSQLHAPLRVSITCIKANESPETLTVAPIH